jgi:hypothetical protein
MTTQAITTSTAIGTPISEAISNNVLCAMSQIPHTCRTEASPEKGPQRCGELATTGGPCGHRGLKKNDTRPARSETFAAANLHDLLKFTLASRRRRVILKLAACWETEARPRRLRG